MIEATEKVINKLKEAAGIMNVKYTICGGSDQKDKQKSEQWLQNLKIKDNKIRLFPNFYASLATFNDENYLILVDHHKDKDFRIPQYLQETDVNSGAWVAIVSELNLSLKENVNEQVKELLGYDWEKNQEDYGDFKPIKFDQKIGNPDFSLEELFYEISLYKITAEKFIQQDQLHQLTGSVLVRGSGYKLLPYSPDVVEKFKDVFENGSTHIPYNNVLASYVSSDYRFSYLDLYRCIELLQPLYFFKNFHLRLGISKSLVEFCEDYYGTIKLPPRFGDSFDKLIGTVTDKPEISLYKIRNLDFGQN